MLELLDMVPNVKCRTSSIRRVHGDCGESGVHYTFDTVKSVVKHGERMILAIEASCEELVQPRGEDDDPHVVLQTNLFKYFGVFAPDTENVGKYVGNGRTLNSGCHLPLVKGIHWCPVHLDEIHMWRRDRNFEVFSAEMGHGRVVHRGSEACTSPSLYKSPRSYWAAEARDFRLPVTDPGPDRE